MVAADIPQVTNYDITAVTPPSSPLADYFTLTPTTAKMRPETPIEEAQVALAEVAVRRDATSWWQGAILNQARDLYGEAWAQLIDEDENKDRLRQIMWVEARIPESLRYASVPFSWYRAVASLPLEKIAELLDAATDDNGGRVWNVTQWQTAVAEAKGKLPKESRGRPARDYAAAVDYCNNRVGEVWNTADAEAIREYLGA